jgi:hypothetical protein
METLALSMLRYAFAIAISLAGDHVHIDRTVHDPEGPIRFEGDSSVPFVFLL